MTSAIKIAIGGARGRMGQEAVRALKTDSRFEICSVLVRSGGQAHSEDTFPVYANLEELLQDSRPDVWLDFTDSRSVVANVDTAIDYGVRPVIGATGYTNIDTQRWNKRLLEQNSGGVAAPNFAIGALLMMRFAAEAAQFMKTAEIVELHHDGKLDAPSGTAKRTAAVISESMRKGEKNGDFFKKIRDIESDNQLSRGLYEEGVRIHSVRLPGLMAHQEVLFGGSGETLTIRHDSLSRSSFMPGVLLACAQVGDLKGLVYGLEHLLW